NFFLIQIHTDSKGTRVVRSRFLKHFVMRRRAAMLLSSLLPAALGVLIRLPCDDSVDLVVEILCNKLLCCIVALIEIDSTNDRLEGVGEDDVACAASISRLALGESQHLIDAKLAGNERERDGINKRSSVAGQITLGLRRIFFIEEVGGRKLE